MSTARDKFRAGLVAMSTEAGSTATIIQELRFFGVTAPGTKHDLASLISDAVRAAVVSTIEHGASVDWAVACAKVHVAAKLDLPRERPHVHRARENEAALAQMLEEEKNGDRRGSAVTVAKRLAVDPHNPLEVSSNAQKLRRLRRNAKRK